MIAWSGSMSGLHGRLLGSWGGGIGGLGGGVGRGVLLLLVFLGLGLGLGLHQRDDFAARAGLRDPVDGADVSDCLDDLGAATLHFTGRGLTACV